MYCPLRMATAVGDSMAYKPPTSHLPPLPNSVSSNCQTASMSSCDASTTKDATLVYEMSFKRKKTDHSPIISPSSTSSSSSSSCSSSSSVAAQSVSVAQQYNDPTEANPIPNETEHNRHQSCSDEQPDVLDLTVPSVATSTNEKGVPTTVADVPQHLDLTSRQSPNGTCESATGSVNTTTTTTTTTTATDSVDSLSLFPTHLNNLSSSGPISSSNLNSQSIVTPPPVGLLHQQQPHQLIHPLGLFGSAGFGAPFPIGTMTSVPSMPMMMGSIPIPSLPPSPNSLYGNGQLTNGLFPSNPFPWTLGSLGSSSPTGAAAALSTLPSLPVSCCSIPPCASSSSIGLDFPLGSMGHQQHHHTLGMAFSPLSDSTTLLNGLSNGNKLPDDVKSDVLVKELLAWSQAVSHVQPSQKSEGTRQIASSNSAVNHHKTKSPHITDANDSIVASPGDEFNQLDGLDHLGCDLSSTNSTSNPIRKYGSFEECSSPKCQSSGMREHYHCQHCEKIIVRREEMIRHAKWHRKREESLQYGFMRYSPGDNCTVSGCAHNGRQTHYHCLQPNCTKVYISTSDVQMHANFHRKDAVIIQEGFQRFRASENCGVSACPFHQERTTHFHCRRPHCRFTFKNKSDMEKHKLHHQKNDNFAKDGFRKFIKYETCGFSNCKYSGIINHIHCIRPGCDYVVHSSSQILSHKRKHDRRFSHLSSSQSNDPTQFSDLSNITFDSTTRTGGCVNQSQLNQSPYDDDLSPTADFGEPLDMKCYPSTTAKSDQDPLTLDTSSDNSPANSATPDLFSSSVLQETTIRRNPGLGDRILSQVIRLFERCMRSSGEPGSELALGERKCNTENPGLGVLFSRINTANTANEMDGDWKIEDEEGDANDELCADLDVLPILQFVDQFWIQSADATGNSDCDSDPNGDEEGEEKAEDKSDRRDPELVSTLPNPLPKCTWPGCANGSPNHSVPNEFQDSHFVRDCVGGDTSTFSNHRHMHIWQATVLRCGLTHCSTIDPPCKSVPCKDSHLHCNFAPACTYTTRLYESDPMLPFDHLVSHDYRFARPVSGMKRTISSADLDGTKSAQSLSTNTYPTPASSGNTKGTSASSTLPGQQPRRRGRPPKYTKYIRVPRPQIPDEFCTDDCGNRGLTRDEFFADKSMRDPIHQRIIGGVKLYLTNEQCPDNLCDYSVQRVEHYHCIRPRCFMTSDSLELMNLHRREFHNHVKIAPGFDYFDRSVDCRRSTCRSKRMNQHYHCTYTNCDYAFVRPSTMLQHARKHEEMTRARRLGLNHTVKFQSQTRCTSVDKLSVRQAAIDQLSSRPVETNEKPPFLPLGLSPLVAAQLPTMFQQTNSSNNNNNNTQTSGGGQADRSVCNPLHVGSPVDGPRGNTHNPDNNNTSNIPTQSYAQNALPGFLPIWAAAMAAAAAVAKQTNGWSENAVDLQTDAGERRVCRDHKVIESTLTIDENETGQDLRLPQQQERREQKRKHHVERIEMDGV